MECKQLMEQFLKVLEEHFPEVVFSETPSMNRINVIFPNKKNKRWMQIDLHDQYFHIAMDHKKQEITSEHVKDLGLYIGHKKPHSSVRLNDSSVKFTFYSVDPYDFHNENFIAFLNEHFRSYKRRIASYL